MDRDGEFPNTGSIAPVDDQVISIESPSHFRLQLHTEEG